MDVITGVKTGEIKATAVIPTMEYAFYTFGKEKYRQILDSLTPTQKQVFKKRMPKNEWIDLNDFLAFNKAILDVAYGGDYSKAQELGRQSANYGMNSFLKIFMKLGNASFFVKKATSIFATYYHPAKMLILENRNGYAKVRVMGLEDQNSILENRIIGFIINLFECTGCKNVKVWTELDTSRENAFILEGTYE